MKITRANPRLMTAVWSGAILIAAGLMWLFAAVGVDDSVAEAAKPGESLAGTKAFAVFVGTSLFEAAIPADLPAAQIFPTAAPSDKILLLRMNARSEEDVLTEFKRALQSDSRRILLEANPLIMEIDRERGFVGAVRETLWDFSTNMRAGVRILLGVPKTPGKNMDLNAVFAGKAEALTYDQVPRIHLPERAEEFRNLLDAARQKGVEVTLILMPRSETAARFFGPVFDANLMAMADDLSKRYSVKVWRPAKAWPNDFFLDQAHVKFKGRERFLNALREYEAASQ